MVQYLFKLDPHTEQYYRGHKEYVLNFKQVIEHKDLDERFVIS